MNLTADSIISSIMKLFSDYIKNILILFTLTPGKIDISGVGWAQRRHMNKLVIKFHFETL